MNPHLRHPFQRARRSLALCLAALFALTFSTGWAADEDALKKLMEENAALRRENADLRQRFETVEARTATPATTTTTTTTTSTSLPPRGGAATAPGAVPVRGVPGYTG